MKRGDSVCFTVRRRKQRIIRSEPLLAGVKHSEQWKAVLIPPTILLIPRLFARVEKDVKIGHPEGWPSLLLQLFAMCLSAEKHHDHNIDYQGKRCADTHEHA